MEVDQNKLKQNWLKPSKEKLKKMRELIEKLNKEDPDR